jgi:hypothetical protein
MLDRWREAKLCYVSVTCFNEVVGWSPSVRGVLDAVLGGASITHHSRDPRVTSNVRNTKLRNSA